VAGVRVDAQRPGPHHRAGPLISRRANSRRSPWTILAVATLAQATSGYVVLGVATLASFAADDFGLGGTATGLIVTAAGLAPLFALVPVGRLLDVHGERRVVTAGGLWLGLGGLVSAFAPSYPLLLAALLLGGVGYATAQPGGSKAVAGWFPDRRGLAMGIRQTGLPLGGALAAATLPALATSWGWRSALGVAGAVGIAGAVAFGLVYDDPEAGDDDVESYEFGPQLRRLLRMPSVRAAAAAGFVMVSAQFCLVSYLLPFLRSETGIAPERGAVALFAVQGCGIAGRIVLAAWSDRTAHRLIPVATAAIAAAVAVAALPPAAGRLELPLLVT
jgi:predicted MFS family arabinose efflux permease